MDDEQNNLDRELTELGVQWRRENPADFVPREFAERRTSWPTSWLLTAAAAVLVIGAVVGAVALSPGGDNAADSPKPTPDVVNRLDCARPAEEPVAGKPAVPERPVAARICGRSTNADGFDSAWPGDTLTDADAAALATQLNQLEPYRANTGAADPACAPTMPFKVVFRYSDGTRVWVHTAGTCGRLSVRGGGDWNGATQISDLALRLIEHERSARTTLNAPIPPVCPLKWQTVGATVGAAPVTADDKVAVTACQYRLTRAAEDANGRLDWQAVVNEPTTLISSALDGSATDPCAVTTDHLQLVQRVLLVRDPYGDISVVSTAPCSPNTLSGADRYPSPTFADQVTALFPARLQTP